MVEHFSSQQAGAATPTAVKAVFFDLSGVLYTGKAAIDGAVEAIQRIQQSGLQARFVTNTSRLSRQTLLANLRDLGFDIHPDQLYSAPAAARAWLIDHGKRPYCLVHENIRCEFADLDQDNPDAVVIGDAADGFNYENLNLAFRLCKQGAPLIGIGRNRYFKLEDELCLDAGPFINAIEYAASTEAIIMGKPDRAFFQQVLNSVDCSADETLMIGDDVFGDVEGALNAGLQACLVQTGKYLAGDEKRVEGEFLIRPSIGEIVDEVLNQVN
jgi:HAD superfamily hydrolase (TIGR01458 family)